MSCVVFPHHVPVSFVCGRLVVVVGGFVHLLSELVRLCFSR